jgi:hypothetical protein
MPNGPSELPLRSPSASYKGKSPGECKREHIKIVIINYEVTSDDSRATPSSQMSDPYVAITTFSYFAIEATILSASP